jgi:hypothetical protein
MRVYLDERCLVRDPLELLLKEWIAIVDVGSAALGVEFYLDSQSVRNLAFVRRFNQLKMDLQAIFRGLVFGATGVQCWRPGRIGNSFYRLSSEGADTIDSSPGESFEERLFSERVALVGSERSSYATRNEIDITKRVEPEVVARVRCAVRAEEVTRLVRSWGALPPIYDIASVRPPTDYETVLRSDPGRFRASHRHARHGRRRIYIEIETNRQFYVDDLHYGLAAHLEVFDDVGSHVGVATLDGVFDVSGRKPGRVLEL